MSLNIEKKIVLKLSTILAVHIKKGISTAEQLTLSNRFTMIRGIRSDNIVGSTCRESMASYARTSVQVGRKSPRYVGFLSTTSMAKCIRYFNRLEKSFGFEGEPTASMVSSKRRLPDKSGSSINIHIIRLNKEWLLSPTLYQVALLIIRMFTRDIISKSTHKVGFRWNGIYRGLNRFDKKKPFNIFRVATIEQAHTSSMYIHHLRAIQDIGYTLLTERHKLYSTGRKGEWSVDRVKTEYGMQARFNFSSTSGPTSLRNTIYAMKDNRLGQVYYYKYDSKKELLKEVFLGGGK